MYKIVCITYVELSTFFNYIYTLIVQNCLHFFIKKKKGVQLNVTNYELPVHI